MATQVINMKGHSSQDPKIVRVDRQTKFGNPFVMKHESERASVISKYRVWLWNEIKSGSIPLDDLKALHGKKLACWCAPRACHADVLAKAAAWAVKQG